MQQVLWMAIIIGITISNTVTAQVGIGTDTPEHTLHIRPATDSEDPIKIEGLQYAFAGDTALLVVNPADGIVRLVTIRDLLKNVTVSNSSDDHQNATEVPLQPKLDIDGDNIQEQNVQQALETLAARLPKGTYRSIGEARAAGLTNGESFYADPKGVLGCSGCIITLYPGME